MRLSPFLFSVAVHSLALGAIAGVGLAWAPGAPARPTWIGLEPRVAPEVLEVPESATETSTDPWLEAAGANAEPTPLPQSPDSALLDPADDQAFSQETKDDPVVDRDERRPRDHDAAWLVTTRRPPQAKSQVLPAPQPTPDHTTPAPLDSAAFVPASELPGLNPPPEYPPAARRLGQAGTVVLLLQIGVTGAVLEASVEVSSNHALLDAAALRAIRSWRYAPATRAGKAVSSALLQPVVFDLTSARANPER